MKERRIDAFEQRVGEKLPADLREHLLTDGVTDEAWLEYESHLDGRVQTIETIFGIDEKASEHGQIDHAYQRFGRILPRGALPVAASLGGLMLMFLPSQNRPGIYYWEHEREPGDDSVEKVADSFSEFKAALEEADPHS